MFNLSMQRSARLITPGYLLNRYPEAVADEQDPLLRWLLAAAERPLLGLYGWRAFQSTFRRIQLELDECMPLCDHELKIESVRTRLQSEGLTERGLIEGLAIMGAAVAADFGFKPHPEQFFCAWTLLRGRLGEMATGEGKSITAGIAAGVAALAGTPVHVITTNDYLVQRDSEGVTAMLQRIGVSCDFVTPDKNDDQRRAAYAADVCYVSNKQLVFDYLRDRQVMGNNPGSLHARTRALHDPAHGQPLLRGLCFAIVDEADSVLIDDAITPLILSQEKQSGNEEIGRVLAALSLARRLEPASDYILDTRLRRITVTERGEERLADLARDLDGSLRNRRFRLELVRQALSAIHLFKRDVDYLVREGEVQLVDQSTGRLMPDRKLQHGLHQMVELKERCELSGESEVLASLSFQHFFRRYVHLCGMTGTAREASAELHECYGLRVVPIPTHQACRRKALAPSYHPDNEAQIEHLIERVNERTAAGQSVLVGARTLAKSESIAAAFSRAGIQFKLLNARQDADEAEVVSKAGRSGAVTIATNMAGRGTDIPLTPEVEASGGLHVIVAELNENARVDRQLIGRSARQGDPGSFEYVISDEDEVVRTHVSGLLLGLKSFANVMGSTLGTRGSIYCSKWAQKRLEGQQRAARKQVAKHDEQMQKRLAFTGYKE